MVFSEHSRNLGKDPAKIFEENEERKMAKKVAPFSAEGKKDKYTILDRLGGIMRRRKKEDIAPAGAEVPDNVVEVDFGKGKVIEEEKN